MATARAGSEEDALLKEKVDVAGLLQENKGNAMAEARAGVVVGAGADTVKATGKEAAARATAIPLPRLLHRRVQLANESTPESNHSTKRVSKRLVHSTNLFSSAISESDRHAWASVGTSSVGMRPDAYASQRVHHVCAIRKHLSPTRGATAEAAVTWAHSCTHSHGIGMKNGGSGWSMAENRKAKESVDEMASTSAGVRITAARSSSAASLASSHSPSTSAAGTAEEEEEKEIKKWKIRNNNKKKKRSKKSEKEENEEDVMYPTSAPVLDRAPTGTPQALSEPTCGRSKKRQPRAAPGATIHSFSR